MTINAGILLCIDVIGDEEAHQRTAGKIPIPQLRSSRMQRSQRDILVVVRSNLATRVIRRAMAFIAPGLVGGYRAWKAARVTAILGAMDA